MGTTKQRQKHDVAGCHSRGLVVFLFAPPDQPHSACPREYSPVWLSLITKRPIDGFGKWFETFLKEPFFGC